MVRIVLGGLVGGVVLFVWGFVSNVVTGLGAVGIDELPDAAGDTAVLKGLVDEIDEPGLYFIPGVHAEGLDADGQQKAIEAFAAKYESGPTAFLVFHPVGSEPMSPRQLGLQFVVCVVSALLASLLLCFATASLPGYLARAAFVLGLGFVVFLYALMPLTIWYRFPSTYMLGQFVDHAIAFSLLGLSLAAIIRPTSDSSNPPADE